MVNYYHEARAQVKKIKTLQEDNKRRAERRAELIDPVAPDPHQQLTVSGTSSKLFRGAQAHAVNEAGENLVPWNGDHTNMIDRFDVRALLDFYKEPDPRVLAARQKTHEESKLEETLRFESYRDLVRLMARGLSEAQGLQVVEQESLERRAQQHAALQAAQDAVYHNPKPGGVAAVTTGPGTSGPGGLPTGSGVYSAIGFSYDAGAGAVGGAAGAAAILSSDDSSSDSDSDSDTDSEDGAGLGPVSEADLAQEAEDDRVDEMAEVFGLEDFSYRLHKALQKEGEEEARVRNAPRRRTGRKRARMRAKRMAGQGLNPATGLPFTPHDPYKDPSRLVNPWEDSRQQRGRAESPDRPVGRRHSPSYDADGWRRAESPGAGGERLYITEFVSAADAGADAGGYNNSSKAQAASASIIDALPDRPDPASWGGMQPVSAAALTVQGIKHDDVHRRLRAAAQEDDSPAYRARSRSRSRSRGRRRRSPTPPRHRARSRSRSRSRGRRKDRSRSRDRSRDRSRGKYSSRRSSSRDRDGGRSRYRSSHRRHSRSRSRSCSRSRSRGRHGDSDCKHRRSGDGERGGGSSRRVSGAGGAAAGSSGSAGARAAGGNKVSFARAEVCLCWLGWLRTPGRHSKSSSEGGCHLQFACSPLKQQHTEH